MKLAIPRLRLITRRARRSLVHPLDRGPLRVMFVVTSMPVGGAETLLVDLLRRMDRERFLPELCCLKTFGELGNQIAVEVPACERLLRHKFDARVWPRLHRLLRARRIDAVVTVGTGDKMFWGRLAAWSAGVPVVVSALHTAGMHDRFRPLNRRLNGMTDAFVAVAESHGHFLVDSEGFPTDKVRVIRNGIDLDRFHTQLAPSARRSELAIADGAPVAGILAALRPEKDHELFLSAAERVRRVLPNAKFVVIGDGPLRAHLEATAREKGLGSAVHFVGSQRDVPSWLAALDVVALSSRTEANPVSILEAMACGKPVVAPRLGSIAEAVVDGVTGRLVAPSNDHELAEAMYELLSNRSLARRMGEASRRKAEAEFSVSAMVRGYEELIAGIYVSKCSDSTFVATTRGGRTKSSCA